MARALGSYPGCHRFKSSRRYQFFHFVEQISLSGCLWPVGQVVKTPPLHGGNTSSTLVRVTIRRHSSAGRALASHARGHRFEFCCLHHKKDSTLDDRCCPFYTPKNSLHDSPPERGIFRPHKFQKNRLSHFGVIGRGPRRRAAQQRNRTIYCLYSSVPGRYAVHRNHDGSLPAGTGAQ